MSEQVYDWKNMEACSGGQASLSRRFVHACKRPVAYDSSALVPLCDWHLLKMVEELSAPSMERVRELEAEVKRTREQVERDLSEERMRRLDEIQERTSRGRSERSRVYFMRNGKYIKIGFTSTSPESRLATIRKAGGILMPKGMDFTATELIGHVPGDIHLEKSLHKKFAAIRIAGEWFEATPKLISFIEQEIAA